MPSSKPTNLDGLFFGLFPRTKQATLPAEVIEAVRLYNRPIHQEVLKDWLVNKDKNAVDAEGQSLFHHATIAGQTGLVEHFLRKGLQKDLEDSRGYTPLILASLKAKEMPDAQRKRVITCIGMLLTAGAKVVSSGPLPQVAANVAAMRGDLDVLKLLEEHGASINDDVMGTPLWWAKHTKSANPELIAYLEAKGCISTLDGPGPKA